MRTKLIRRSDWNSFTRVLADLIDRVPDSAERSDLQEAFATLTATQPRSRFGFRVVNRAAWEGAFAAGNAALSANDPKFAVVQRAMNGKNPLWTRVGEHALWAAILVCLFIESGWRIIVALAALYSCLALYQSRIKLLEIARASGTKV